VWVGWRRSPWRGYGDSRSVILMRPYEIIIAALSGHATDRELRELAEWRRADGSHEAALEELAEGWRLVGEQPRPVSSAPVPDAGRIIRRAELTAPDLLGGSGAWRGEGRGSWGARGYWGLLAAGLAAVAVVVGLMGGRSSDFGAVVFRTGVGELATVQFSDGSIARLGPETSLSVPGGGRQRMVHVEGEAYFTVASDSQSAFVVRTPAGVATVLGTRFNVRTGSGRLEVAVIEGEVAVAGAASEARVHASQIAVVEGGAPVAVQSVADVYRTIAWVGEFLALEATPLRNVIPELERRFDLRVQVTDTFLLDRTMTGWFADQPPEQILIGICRAVDAICSARDGLVIMEAVSR